MPGGRLDRAAALLGAPPLRALLARLPAWRGVLVLNYHRIGVGAGGPWDPALYSASAEGFDAQLALLAREAEVVSPGDLPGLAAAGRGRHLLITFDDGYRDNFELAFPLLRSHGLTATFFLTSGFLDGAPHVAWWDELTWMARGATRPVVPAGGFLPADVPLADPEHAAPALIAAYKRLPAARTEAYLDHVAAASGAGRCGPADAAALWMTWDHARELRDGGMAVGGHTVTHPVLAQLPADAQEREVAGCAERLRVELGEPMRWFSYPVGFPGSFTEETRAILRRHGVELAFSFHGGWGRFARWDPLDVPRIHVGPLIGPERVGAALRLPQLFARRD